MGHATSATDHELCNQCLRHLPVDHFDRVRSGSEKRRAKCRECTNEYLREYYRRKRALEFTTFTQWIEQRKDRPSVVEDICAVMVHRFGGLDNFAHEWYSHIMEAPRGSAFVCRQLKCIVQLIMVSSQIQMQRDAAMADLSGEELEREIEIRAREVVEVDS